MRAATERHMQHMACSAVGRKVLHFGHKSLLCDIVGSKDKCRRIGTYTIHIYGERSVLVSVLNGYIQVIRTLVATRVYYGRSHPYLWLRRRAHTDRLGTIFSAFKINLQVMVRPKVKTQMYRSFRSYCSAVRFRTLENSRSFLHD